MKNIFFLLKWLLFGFGIVPIVFSLIISTIEFNTAPQFNPMYETESIAWTTFFSRYFWLTISYYSGIFCFGLFFFEYVKLVMKSFKTQDSIKFKIFTYFIYFVLFQFVALKATNFSSDYFHYGNEILSFVILLFSTSILFSWLYYLLFRQRNQQVKAS